MNLAIDIKYVIQSIKKRIRLSLLIIFVMSIGLALSIFTFSILNSMVHADLPLKNGERIVAINGAANHGKAGLYSVDARDFFELRQEVQTVTDTGAYALTEQNVTFREATQKYRAAFAEWNLFNLTATQPVLGRLFVPEDNSDGAERIMLLSYEVWQRDFDGDPSVLDTKLLVDGRQTRIVGVMPAGYAMPRDTQIWLPLRDAWLKPAQRRSGMQVGGYAMLKENHSLEDLNKELSLISARYREMFPQTNTAGLYYYATSFPNSLWVETDKDGLLISLKIINVLIMALCIINVGNLVLTRMNERTKEFSIRVALGSPFYRLVILVILECFILCAIACLIGIALAIGALEFTEQFLLNYMYNNAAPFWLDLRISAESYFYIPLSLTVTVLLICVVPIIKAAKGNFIEDLKDGTRGAQGTKVAFISTLLVCSQVILSVLVLISSLVMVSSNYINSKVDYGVVTKNALTATIQLPRAKYQTLEEMSQYYGNFVRNLEAAANIRSVAAVSRLPSDYPLDGSFVQPYEIEGAVYANPEDRIQAVRVYAQTGSLEAMGVNLLEGRYFSQSDTPDSERVVIITKTLADRLWPNQNSVGKRLRLGRWSAMNWMTEEHMPWMTVVAVTEDVYNNNPFGFKTQDRGSAYIPLSQRTIWSSHTMQIAVYYDGAISPAMKVLDEVRKALDPQVGIYDIQSFDDRINKNGMMNDAVGKLFLACGLLSLLLASISIYGVISNVIQQKQHEIGVRRALGATDSNIIVFFVKTSTVNVLLSLPIGILCSVYFNQLIAKHISITNASNMLVFITVPLVVLVIAVIAALIPTRRAIELSPSEALREN
ncbi:ABC transporter permease [Rheinheimera sp. SA_1]|uniref:ABC transporter permease n=1 Tax=Rheinheimera sp. SA_1 TaxID=1827365 RepID=UPI000A68F344|nr:ABC transporter permease [Rheinheimera sp. SA_1]